MHSFVLALHICKRFCFRWQGHYTPGGFICQPQNQIFFKKFFGRAFFSGLDGCRPGAISARNDIVKLYRPKKRRFFALDMSINTGKKRRKKSAKIFFKIAKNGHQKTAFCSFLELKNRQIRTACKALCNEYPSVLCNVFCIKMQCGKAENVRLNLKMVFNFILEKVELTTAIFLFLKFEKSIHENDQTKKACHFCNLDGLQRVPGVPVPVPDCKCRFCKKVHFAPYTGYVYIVSTG